MTTMRIKDILSTMAELPTDANVNISIIDGLKAQVYPAHQIQIFVSKENEKEKVNVIIGSIIPKHTTRACSSVAEKSEEPELNGII